LKKFKMRDQFKEISKNMIDFACSVASVSIYQCIYMPMIEYQEATAVSLMAQAIEIILKARLAQEHPLLIFEKVPKYDPKKDSIEQLFLDGKTVSYLELPNMLQLTLGYSLSDAKLYKDLWNKRSQLIHFGIHKNDYDISEIVLGAGIKILEPVLHQFWGRTIFDTLGDLDTYAQGNFIEACVNYGFDFTLYKDVIIDGDIGDESIFPDEFIPDKPREKDLVYKEGKFLG
jgi:hypothetical protein